MLAISVVWLLCQDPEVWIAELSAPDASRRDEAMQRLIDAGPGLRSRVEELLRHADPEVASRAQSILSAYRIQEVTGAWREDHDLREIAAACPAAVEVCVQGAADRVPELLEALTAAHLYGCRRRLLLEYARLAPEGPGQERFFQTVLSEFYTDGCPDEIATFAFRCRSTDAAALLVRSSLPERLDLAWEATLDWYPPGIVELMRSPDPLRVDSVAACIERTPAPWRASLWDSLRMRCDPGLVESLLSSLPWAHGELAWSDALALQATPGDLPRLRQAASDHPALRYALLHPFAAAGEDVAGELISMIRSDPERAAPGVRAIHHMSDSSARAVLLAMLEAPTSEWHRKAAIEIAARGMRDLAPLAVERLRGEAFLDQLLSLEDPSRADRLRRRLREAASPDNRTEAVAALAAAEEERALPDLLPLMGGGYEFQDLLAAEITDAIVPADAVSQLLDLAEAPETRLSTLRRCLPRWLAAEPDRLRRWIDEPARFRSQLEAAVGAARTGDWPPDLLEAARHSAGRSGGGEILPGATARHPDLNRAVESSALAGLPAGHPLRARIEALRQRVEDPSSSALDALARFVREAPSAEERIVAVHAVGEVPGDRATGILAEALDQPHFAVRIEAAIALALRADRRALILARPTEDWPGGFRIPPARNAPAYIAALNRVFHPDLPPGLCTWGMPWEAETPRRWLDRLRGLAEAASLRFESTPSARRSLFRCPYDWARLGEAVTWVVADGRFQLVTVEEAWPILRRLIGP